MASSTSSSSLSPPGPSQPAPTSTSTSTLATLAHSEVRPQAGPLPTKRGEIGYQEGSEPEMHGSAPDETPDPLPARHPADRDTPVTSTGEGPHTPHHPPSSSAPPEESDSSSTHSRNSSFLKSKRSPIYLGIRLTSWAVLLVHILVLVGTILLWVFATKRIRQDGSGQSQSDNPPSTVFIHVLFGILATGQLLFLERRIFHTRAERYMYLHRDEIVPTRDPNGSTYMGFAPWNRPSLPTYAAALAQSGVGTGDVEDHLIAAPPPPAYGNTRGSTLLLAGFLRESLRAQRPRSDMSDRSGRPLSYVSREEGWEEIRDADRARRLGETLATLENRIPSTS